MKVLVVTAAYPAPTDPVRAVYVETITRRLAECRVGLEGSIDVRVVAPRIRRDDPRRETRLGIPIRRFSYPSRGRRLKELGRPPVWMLGAYLLSALWAVEREVLGWKPDVILCHWVIPTGPAAALVARLHRRPYVLVAHGSDVHRYAVRSWLARRMARFALKRARRVIAVSAELSRMLIEELSVPPDSIGVVPMGVDEDVFAPESPGPESSRQRIAAVRQALGVSPSTMVLLFVGDLVVEKGLWEALGAFRKLRDEGRAVELCVVGDGPLRRDLDGLLASGEPGLRVLGRQPQAVVADWYRASDVLVLPSYGEGTPLVVLEALTCGLPVVASRVGGIPDLIEDGVTGKLVVPSNQSSLEEALRGVLDRSVLNAMRETIIASSRPYGARGRAEALSRELAVCVSSRTSRRSSGVAPSPGGTDG